MTQSSRPQADNNSTVAYVDAGPYSRDEWAERMRAAHSGDANTASSRTRIRGVVPTYDNLLVTTISGTDVEVGTGGGMTYGSYLFNDALVTFSPPAAGANSHIDLVCIVENNTNAAVLTDSSGNTWTFPNVVADYAAGPAVPPYSARLVIISGTDAAVPADPTLDQLSTLYCVPIAEYEIDTVPAISNFVDRREFLDIEKIVGVATGDNATIEEASIIGAQVTDGVGAAGLGVAIRAQLENDSGDLEDAGQIAFRWTDATNGSEGARYELRLSSANADNLSAVINAPPTASVDGNARGTGAFDFQSVRGAAANVASGTRSFIAGGQSNTAAGGYTFATGFSTEATGDYSHTEGFDTVAIGSAAHAEGGLTQASGEYSHAEGVSTIASGDYSHAAGASNTASGDYGTVGGGDSHNLTGDYAVISGGHDNDATANYVTIGGGQSNDASGVDDTIGGGNNNTASSIASTVAGGLDNTASNDGAAVAGGEGNTASGGGAAIAGGYYNTASGQDSGIPGGARCAASLGGQIASAYGYFAAQGDAQGTIQLVARCITAGGGAGTTMYLDGAATRITIAADSAWTYDILCVAMAQNAAAVHSSRAYGVLYRDNANNTALASTTGVVVEQAGGCTFAVTADNANEALQLTFTDDSVNVFRAVATIRLAQVSYP